MRFGYVIRLGGDPDISGALASGIAKASPRYRTSEESIRRVAMMRHTPDEWAAMIARAQYDYGQVRATPKWAAALLGLYALIVDSVAGWWEWLSDWNRGGED